MSLWSHTYNSDLFKINHSIYKWEEFLVFFTFTNFSILIDFQKRF